MKEKSPAFQFYVKQWLGDDMVMLMDWDARGMHVHLMCISWQQKPRASIPNDKTMIRKWLKDPLDEAWNRVWPQILRAWEIRGDRLYQIGLLREWKKQRAYSISRKLNAKKRWESRPKQADAHASAVHMHSDALLLQSSSSSSTAVKDTSTPLAAAAAKRVKAPKKKPQDTILFWQAMIDHINEKWKAKKGSPYPFDARDWKPLKAKAAAYQAWGIMALWDRYMQGVTYWGPRRGFALSGFFEDMPSLVDDQGMWKIKAKEYEEKLTGPAAPELLALVGGLGKEILK